MLRTTVREVVLEPADDSPGGEDVFSAGLLPPVYCPAEFRLNGNTVLTVGESGSTYSIPVGETAESTLRMLALILSHYQPSALLHGLSRPYGVRRVVGVVFDCEVDYSAR